MGFFDKLTGPAKKPEKKKEEETKAEPEKSEIQQQLPQKGGQLTLDIYETDDEFIIQSTVAGVKPEDLDISIDGDLVSIKGSRERFSEEKKGKYIYQECYWGEFSREIILPEEVDETKIEATIKNGVFTLKLPKAHKSKKKKIEISLSE
jgi:HSP20 family protein